MPDRPSGRVDRGRKSGASGNDRELLSQLFDSGSFFKLIALLLVFAAVPLAEIFLFIYIGHLIGNFLVLVLAVLASAGGAALVADQASRAAARLGARRPWDKSPGPEVVDLAGILAGGILLVTPGFITDLCGFLLLFPRTRRAAGKMIAKAMGPRLADVLQRAGLVQRLKIR